MGCLYWYSHSDAGSGAVVVGWVVLAAETKARAAAEVPAASHCVMAVSFNRGADGMRAG